MSVGDLNFYSAIAIFWHLIGGVVLMSLQSADVRPVYMSTGFEFVNPVYVYNTTKVNVFGAVVVSLLLGACFPICTMLYWFYKLCTFGRK
jgi:hypothetical protein